MKKFLKKTLKILAWTLGVLIVAGLVGFLILDKKLPEGVEGPEAEELADKMLAAVNKPAWDSLAYLQYTYFKGGHQILWDKRRNFAEVKWDDHRVIVDPSAMEGIAWEEGTQVHHDQDDKLITKALTLFWNDTYWLAAPFKVRDPGTTRSVVTNEDGSKSLLVGHSSGGRTPGDHYLWHLDANGLPTAWQMWVKILPIGGVRMGWADWKPLNGGAMVAFTRTSALSDLHFPEIKGGMTWADIGITEDPFLLLENRE